MASPVEPIRAYQLPENVPGQIYLSPYNLASNAPVYITPGFGGNGGNQLPPLVTGAAHFDETVSSYCEAAQVETPKKASDDGDREKKKRQAHVKRVFATTPEGGATQPGRSARLDAADEEAINTEIWIDVLRIDRVSLIYRPRLNGLGGQSTQFKLKWNDDPENPKQEMDNSKADKQGEFGNGTRKMYRQHIRDPDNPDGDHVKLFLINKMQFTVGEFISGKKGQKVRFKFNNKPTGNEGQPDEANPDSTDYYAAKRTVKVIKLVNNDLDGMTMSDTDGTKPKIVTWLDYLDAMKKGKTDDSQHLEVEFCTKWKKKFRTEYPLTAKNAPPNRPTKYEISFSLPQTRELTDPDGYAVDENGKLLFAPGDENAVNVKGKPCVIRTDPFQAIVNFSFGGLAVIFAPGKEDSPKFTPPEAMIRKINELFDNEVLSAS